jgi:tetratricopeptide (TPR) repeat protein
MRLPRQSQSHGVVEHLILTGMMHKTELREELRKIESLASRKLYGEAWSRLEIMKPDNPQDEALIWATRGFVHLHQDDNEAAISDYNKSIKSFDKEPHPYFMRGIIFFQIQNYENAIFDFSKVLELCDAYKSDYYRESAYFFRADSYVHLKKFDKAISDCVYVRDGFQMWTNRLRTKEAILSDCSVD